MASSNLLIGAMPDQVQKELEEAGADVSLPAGHRLPQECLEGSQVFVVTSGIASKFQLAEDGRISEVGMVGREGMFPVCALLGVPAAPHIVLSQNGDLVGRKIRTREFRAIVREVPEAALVVRKYVYSFLTQIASNILSSEQNTIQVRLARWLLMCHDRVDDDRITITHDALAQMTFSHRPTITNALAAMKELDLIDTGRGCITIRSRRGLRQLAEGSYGLSERYWQEHIGPFGKDYLV